MIGVSRRKETKTKFPQSLSWLVEPNRNLTSCQPHMVNSGRTVIDRLLTVNAKSTARGLIRANLFFLSFFFFWMVRVFHFLYKNAV